MVRRLRCLRPKLPSTASCRLGTEQLEARRPFSANQCRDAADELSAYGTIPAGVPAGAAPYAHRDFAPIASATKVAAANDYRIDGLSSGYKWGTRNITYSFYAGGSYYGSESRPTPVSAAVKENVRYILNQVIAPIIDVTFTEVPDSASSYGLLRYLCSSSASYAYAYLPTGLDTNNGSQMDVVGDVVFNPSNDVIGTDFNSKNNSFQSGPGSHGFSAIIHETGHALGLKHPFESPVLPRGEENWDNTVMTYNFVGAEPATMMAYDILTLQYFYGASSSTRSGDTTYVFTSADAFSPGSGSSGSPSQPFAPMKHTLWDAGGIDTIDLSALPAVTGGYRVDLRPGGWITPTSSFDGIRYGSSYTSTNYGTRLPLNGTTIEHVVASRFSDTIYLNTASNSVGGYTSSLPGGADVIYGADQRDRLDLSLFLRSSVVETQVGNDLVISLGSAGSVTLKDYYAGAASSRPAILYMDPPPTATISDTVVIEGNAGESLATFTIGLSFAPLQQVVLNVATQDGTATAQAGDYFPLPAGTTVVFAPGRTTATVQVRVRGDVTFEPDETFSVVLSDPQRAIIGDGTGICSIKNDDPVPLPGISVSDVRVTEGNAGTALATITVSLSWAVAQDVTVSYRTQDGTATLADGDYVTVPAGRQLLIPAGQTTATIALQVNGDWKAEADETFFVVLSDPRNAVIKDGVCVCTITADDVGIVSTTVYGMEGTGVGRVVQIPVRLVGVSSRPVTVYFQTTGGTATGGLSKDYRDARGVVTFQPGETEKRVAVSIVGDSLPESDEEFTLRVRRSPESLSGSTGPGGGEADIRVVIVDDDSRFFRIRPYGAGVTAGDVASFDVTLDRSPTYGPVLPLISGASNPDAVLFPVRYVVGNSVVTSTNRWNQPGNLDFQMGTLAFGYSTGPDGVSAVMTRRVDVVTAAVDKRRTLVMQLFTLENARQDIGMASQGVEPRSRTGLFRSLGGQRLDAANLR